MGDGQIGMVIAIRYFVVTKYFKTNGGDSYMHLLNIKNLLIVYFKSVNCITSELYLNQLLKTDKRKNK